jgi:ABC-type branched-subunit amino acid transport system ATPase component/ABC-type branched-subunit amino acid transport system permease subunit
MRSAWAASAALMVVGVTAALKGNGYQLFVLGTVAVTAIAATGLNVLLGLAGQISLGHAAFYAIGAYTASILATRGGLDLITGGVLGAILAAAAGALLALPAVRVRGPYLAMVTIAFGFVVEQGAAEWKTMTGGWNGMSGVPKPVLQGHVFSESELTILCVVIAALMVPAFARFTTSRWGLMLRATRDAEVAAQSLGANLVAARTLAFAISAGLTGLAGALFASLTGFISPESFPFFQSITFLLVVLVGGAGAAAGPIYGALVVVLLPEMLAFLAEYRLLFFGSMLLLVLLIAPTGIAGTFAVLTNRLRANRRPDAPPIADPACVTTALASITRDALRVSGLTISFGGNRAVSEVSLTAQPGRITSLIGPNGAGKTTLLNMVSGFYRPDAGAIALGATALAGRASYHTARAGIARTFQTSQLFAGMTVRENLQVAAARGRLLGAAPAGADATQLLDALLDWVGYTGPVLRLAGELPHVDRRLVEIARALAARPSALLLDEPAAGLSAEDTQRLGAVLTRIAAQGVAVLIIEHDMDLVMRISDHVYVLDAGRMIAHGSPAEVQASAAVRAAYLGDAEFSLPPAAERAAGQHGRGDELLAVQRLTTGYGAAPVLDNVSLNVKTGELIAVLGANGAGKSTLMRAMAGLHRPVKGSVFFGGHEIRHLAAHRVARAGLTLVPEGRQVFPELSVEDNLRLGAHRIGGLKPEYMRALFALFPKLETLRARPAGLLSGGEQQMLAVARGLAAEPRVLLLDEPSLGLAPAIVQELFGALARLRLDGVTILLVDQMAQLALALSDRAYVIAGGRVVFDGTAAALREQPVLEKAYLGGQSISAPGSRTEIA